MGGNFRNHCDRANFVDFKRVSSGLSNAIGRPAGGVYKSRRLTGTRAGSFALRRISWRYTGATERGWWWEKTERKRRNGEGRMSERASKRVRENEQEWQLNAISRESNGSLLETRGSD